MHYDSSNLESVVYETGTPGTRDVPEQFHVASKLSRPTIRVDLSGAARLQRSEALQAMVLRSARTYAHRPAVQLPEANPRPVDFYDVMLRRRSAEAFSGAAISAQALSDLLHHSYRAHSTREGDRPRRPTPSAGALYPLDIYLLALNTDASVPVNSCLYYDPFRHQLAHLTEIDESTALDPFGENAATKGASIIFVIAAMFSRSRIKYGARGARFCYMEAGHLAQSILLAADAANLQARAFGGFFDEALCAMIPGLDGVDSAPVHTVILG